MSSSRSSRGAVLDGNLQPFAVEGIKTIAYEIAEQLDWKTPDAIVSPVASGALFAKLAQGFVELADLGLVSDPPPRMYGAQPGGCPPVAAAWADERPPSRVTPDTVARSLAVGDPELRRARDRRRSHVGRVDHRRRRRN